MFIGLYGLIGLAWGAKWLKASFFPFFLFAFCVPISSISQGVTFPLRLLVSKIVWLIAHGMLRFSVVRVGTQLMTHFMDVAKTHYPAIALNVRANNPAFRLYQKLGFKIVGEMTNRVGQISYDMQFCY